MFYLLLTLCSYISTAIICGCTHYFIQICILTLKK
uniref:Uncharacterized protein n=1 Tax=Anguilla anguilla TaxID=7936 RepID=A0A0E9PU31_ANGAN